MGFFGIIALILAVIATAFFIPVMGTYLATGLVPDFPTLIVCGFTMLSAIQSLFVGVTLETMAQKKEIQVGQGPHGVRTSSDGRWAYVTVAGEDKIVVIDLSTLEIEDSISPGEGSFPFWVAVQGNM